MSCCIPPHGLSLEEAISMIDSDELEWEEDLETRILSRTTWSLLDENGDTEEDGIVEDGIVEE